MKKLLSLLLALTVICATLTSCFGNEPPEQPAYGSLSEDELPSYTGKAYVIINNNLPEFTDEEKSVTKSYEFFSELDELGRLIAVELVVKRCVAAGAGFECVKEVVNNFV